MSSLPFIPFFAQTEPVDPNPVTDLAADLIFTGITVVAVLVLHVVTSRLLRFGLVRIAERAAKAETTTRWKVRIQRLTGEASELADLRRRQRIEATASGLSRLVGVFYVLLAIVLILHRFEIDLALALTSAGFLGAVLSIGGQHHVQDYLTGLQVLIEDRYGVGDELEVQLAAPDPVRGRVVWLGAFATRVEDGVTTWHIANRFMTAVANHSQLGVETVVRVSPPAHAGHTARDVSGTAQAAAASLDTASVMLVQSVEPSSGDDTAGWQLRLRGHRGLSDAEQQALVDEIQRRLS